MTGFPSRASFILGQMSASSAMPARRPRRLADHGTRFNPHPHGREPEPRQGPRKAHGSSPFPHTGTEERGHQAARAGRTLDELARSYNVSRATISRLTVS